MILSLTLQFFPMDIQKIKEFFASAKSFSPFKKVLIVLIVVLGLIYALSSCTSMRSTSVRVDKAEKVDINVTDSISGVYPTL